MSPAARAARTLGLCGHAPAEIEWGKGCDCDRSTDDSCTPPWED